MLFLCRAPKVLRGCIVYHPPSNYKVPFIHLTILQFASDEMGRVRLRFGQKKGSDYINASFVDVGTSIPSNHYRTPTTLMYTGV